MKEPSKLHRNLHSWFKRWVRPIRGKSNLEQIAGVLTSIKPNLIESGLTADKAAKNARSYFIEFGVDMEDIQIISYGSIHEEESIGGHYPAKSNKLPKYKNPPKAPPIRTIKEGLSDNLK